MMGTLATVSISAGAIIVIAAAVGAFCIAVGRISAPWKARRAPWLRRALLAGLAGLALVIIGGIAGEVL